MEIQSQELEDYLSSSLAAIKKGVEAGKNYVIGPVEFNLAVTNIKEGGGGVKIFVANAEGKLKSEEISYIKINVQMKRDVAPQFIPRGREPRNSSI